MTDVIINKPTNNYEATVLALVLAITADTDTKVSACIKLAEGFGLSCEDMERAKQTALLQLSDRASLSQC
tara:strand:- start:222 stop:431 length:210 start_codon:yes stop_codon:yes gene_type:complete